MHKFLEDEHSPLMLIEGLKLHGVTEVPGAKNNQTILGWATECGIKGYHADEIPWCGLSMAVVAKRAGKPLPAKPLWALDWLNWGEVCEPELGCIMVFFRKGGGHVGLYVGEDSTHYYILSGNQSNQFNISRLSKDRFKGARNFYKIAKPPNVRKIIHPDPVESVESTNEH